MVILTEQMVETKSKVSDIHRVISLNACGIDLHDISILQRMPRIEVLVLSVNKIRSLASLQNCLRLKEVYLRRNEIPSFDQLKHLRNAQGLRSLSMGENPCSEAAGANYRACVLRMLPQVTKLDDVEVCESEQTAAFQSMPYPAPKSKIRAPIPRSVTNPKGTAARASGENFDRERMQGECRPRATAGQNPLAPFEECSAEDEILLSVPSPREQRRFASARAHPDCLREHSQDVIPAVNQESTRFENHSGHWLPSEFADPLPLACPAVSPVPSFSGMNSRPSMRSTMPRFRAETTAAGPGAFHFAQSRLGAVESFVRRQSTAPDEPANDLLASGRTEVILGTPGTSSVGLRRLRTNSNLLSSALCLIREMDGPSLEALSHAIGEMLQKRSHSL